MAYVTRGEHYATPDILRTHAYPSATPEKCGCTDCRNLRQSIKAEYEKKYAASNISLKAEINRLNALVARYESKAEISNRAQRDLEADNAYNSSQIEELEREVEVLKMAKREWKVNERHLLDKIEEMQNEQQDWKIARRNLLADLDGLKKEKRGWEDTEMNFKKQIEVLQKENRRLDEIQHNFLIGIQNTEISGCRSAQNQEPIRCYACRPIVCPHQEAKMKESAGSRWDDKNNESNGNGYLYGNSDARWTGTRYC
ncbi:hypothetical protein BZA77DRAFT_297125 [Pyronema omphalodes]|nr:hypothetical protein BZA77DRAFT_297125 [Pyronema omphalodes]